MRKAVRILFAVFVIGVFFFCLPAHSTSAQDFYGEGNVLVAVDMSAYAENENVIYPEGTMGTLTWGDDAPTGVSTREAFGNRTYTVPDDISAVKAPEYKIEKTYEVGQKMILPIPLDDDVVMNNWGWYPGSIFPEEIFENSETPLLYSPQNIKEVDGETLYYACAGQAGEDELVPLMDFLEIECVYTGEYSTVWQYTGVVYSNRKDFDAQTHGEAINLTESEIKIFADICDESYTIQKEIFGDPAFEDSYGDRDGKAAYVVIDEKEMNFSVAAYYSTKNTVLYGFDSLVCKAKVFRSYLNGEYGYSKSYFLSALVHELNHYILAGLTEHKERSWSVWLGEAFAQYSTGLVSSEAVALIDGHLVDLTNGICSKLMGTPGMVWDYYGEDGYPMLANVPYALGSAFLQFVERMTTGKTDGSFWTGYFYENMQNVTIATDDVDKYLKEKTGEGLKEWMARFMVSFTLNYDNWFNSFDDYGKNIGSFSGDYSGVYAVKGGGTTYVYTNYDGGRIAVTGADDDWYFFATTLDIPDPDSPIVISSAQELAQIGKEHSYPFNGRYVLANDIDLGGESSPWEPIGGKKQAFRGQFDGQGHTISGLWAVHEDKEGVGLFGWIDGDSLIENLTVEGVATGFQNVGGIVGRIGLGTVRNCRSSAVVTGYQCIGGICGEGSEGAVISGCSASGMINGVICEGGILGGCVQTTITGCLSDATVSGEHYVGGVVGYAEGATASDLVFSGEVNGTDAVGGIIGVNYASHVTGCKNSGNVEGVDRVGGIAGSIADYCLTENCRNSGRVTGSGSVGGIVGFIFGADLSVCHNDQSGISSVGDADACSYSFGKNGDTTVLSRKWGQESFKKDVIETFTWDGLVHRITAIGKGAMRDVESLKKLTIGEYVKKIGSEAFAGNKKLKLIELSASVTKIGKNAFKGIAQNAVFKIKASEQDFERIVNLLKKSGVSTSVTFERVTA